MLNQMVLVGRLVRMSTVEKNKEGKSVLNITLSIPRSYKNEHGEYEMDFVPVTLYGSVAENTAEYCRQGDLIGVKGCIDGTNEKVTLVAEKITFLTSKPE